MRVPASTYRLQLHDEFTLHDARELVPYFAALGITDLYLSPIFEARSGSTHGYDVTDPTRVRASIGGEPALRRLSATAQRHGLGILLDIVPNHMAASTENPWWRDMLLHGRLSAYARFFDVDWDRGGRIMLPILGDAPAELIARGELSVDARRGELVYFDTRLPLAHGSTAGIADPSTAIADVLARQHYELVYWRTAAERMNYRRFFDITDLAGVRVEEPDVFEAMHGLVRSLAGAGIITGLRIDHVDGLRDPAGYLVRLRQRVRGPDGRPVYTVVEKILERDERLPPEWPCEGTTGYEFLDIATGLLIEPDGHGRIEAFYRRVTGDPREFGDLIREKKLLVMQRLFGGELTALANSADALLHIGHEEAHAAVRELTASMGVYRTYMRSAEIRAEDGRRLMDAVTDAQRRAPEHAAAIASLHRLLLLEHEDQRAALDWVMRWQQFTGPVMAKGFEDTALYCHNALLAVNDVGSDPSRPCLTARELHDALAERLRRQPRSLNATATHDTKRGEDTRARIAVIAELPDEWRTLLRRWMREGDEWKAELPDDEDRIVQDADVDSLLYQTLLGAWPFGGPDARFTDRVQQYMTKAVREAKEQTSWRRPDEEYEQALTNFVGALVESVGRAGLPEEIGAFADRLAPHGAINSLAQLLLKITAPGIPDIYQGTELWSFTLVDPDNRGPVEYATRRRLLEQLAPLLEDARDATAVSDLLGGWRDGRLKLYVTAAALHCRRRHAALLDAGSFTLLQARGAIADHILAFARGTAAAALITVVPRWTTRLTSTAPRVDPAVWRDTVLQLPAAGATWRDVLTGATVNGGDQGVVGLAEVLALLPVALLEPA